MNLIHCKQGSLEWKQARLGLFTASNANQIITPEGKPSRSARKHLYRLVYEKLIRESAEKDKSYLPAVQNGIQREPIARQAFRERFSWQVEETGLWVDNTANPRFGCSPDGLIPDRHEIVEIKSPEGPTQIGYLLDGDPEATYQPQLQMQLLVGGWRACHFFSWHPRLPPYYKLIEPDRDYQKKLVALMGQFLIDVEHETARARTMGNFLPVAEAYLAVSEAIEIEAEDE
jgi:hypothetical protein